MQEFLLAASQLAMTRAQSAASALADRIEELAIHATFVQASPHANWLMQAWALALKHKRGP